jgi:hypothetical protein
MGDGRLVNNPGKGFGMPLSLKIATQVTLLLGVVLLCTAPGAARAQQVLDFSYTFGNGDVESGVLTGSLAGNYFTVTGIQSFSVDGTDRTSYVTGDLLESFDAAETSDQGYNGNGTAVVTIDGSYLDLFSAGQEGNFYFAAGDVYANQYYADVAVNTVGYQDEDNPFSTPFSASRWTAVLVPEPGSLGLMAGALGMLGVIAGRRRAA